jgi:hypothetical protein
VRRIVTLAFVLALGAVAAGGAAQARTGTTQGMYGIQITNFKVNPNKTVTINVKIRGLKLAPAQVGKKNVAGEGHWHIFVNGKYNNFSAATSGRTKPLKKGDYKVYVTLNNNDHSPLSEPARSKTISVMVD